MGNGFQVHTSELRQHATSIESVADGVDTAAEAAQEKRMGGQIYGVLFDPTILPLLNMWADHLHDSITKEAELGRTIAKGVRTNADIYDSAEQDTTTTVKQSGEGH